MCPRSWSASAATVSVSSVRHGRIRSCAKRPQNAIRSLVSTLVNSIKADGEAPSEALVRPARIIDRVLGDANLVSGLQLGAVFDGGADSDGRAAAILGGSSGATAAAEQNWACNAEILSTSLILHARLLAHIVQLKS